MTSTYRWAWFALAAVAVALALWSQRYEYISCTPQGYCAVANRFTGEVGVVPHKLKRAELIKNHSGLQIDSLFRAIEP